VLTHADVHAPQVLIDPRTGKPRVNEKTKQPLTRKDLGISTHPSLNLDKSRKSRAHLPDEQVLIDPHALTHADVCIANVCVCCADECYAERPGAARRGEAAASIR